MNATAKAADYERRLERRLLGDFDELGVRGYTITEARGRGNRGKRALEHRFDVYGYCLLPQEMVMIVRGKDRKANMKEFLHAFRAQSSAALEQELGHPLWKKKYFERVLRKHEDTKQLVASLFQRPVKAGLVKDASAYPFQGSFVLVPRIERRI